MKKLIFYLSACIAITALIGFCSCSDRDASDPLPPQTEILGKWKEVARGFDKKMSLEPSEEIIEFLPNGRIESNSENQNLTYRIDSVYFYYGIDGVDYSIFKYRFSSDMLQLEFDSYANGVYPYIYAPYAPIYFRYKKLN